MRKVNTVGARMGGKGVSSTLIVRNPIHSTTYFYAQAANSNTCRAIEQSSVRSKKGPRGRVIGREKIGIRGAQCGKVEERLQST